MSPQSTIPVFLTVFLGAVTVAFLSCAADNGGLNLPGKLHKTHGASNALVGMDGWDGFTIGMSPEETRALIEKKGIDAKEDEAHGMFPSANGESHSCRTFHHFRYKMNGWFVNLDLSGYRLERISLAAPDRYGSDRIESLVNSLTALYGKPSFQQPLVTDFRAPRCQWSSGSTSLTLTTWPDGPEFGVVVTLEGNT